MFERAQRDFRTLGFAFLQRIDQIMSRGRGGGWLGGWVAGLVGLVGIVGLVGLVGFVGLLGSLPLLTTVRIMG